MKNQIKTSMRKKSITQKRISKWKKAKSKETSKLRWDKKEIDKKITIGYSFTDENLTQKEKEQIFNSNFFAMTGSAGEDYQRLLHSQTMMCFFKPISEVFGFETILNAAKEALLALDPQDPIEGMLCSRLIILHHQYMDFLSRIAAKDQTNASIDINVNRATKFMRLYNETLEALNRHRRKGKQQVIVQHVNVNEGGQAIVGSKINNRRGREKK